MLRMENLDTDIPPPVAAVEATRAAVGTDEANSWLPFTGMSELKQEVVRMIGRRGGPQYDPEGEVVITSGEGDNMLDALLALTDPGDEVIVPDPTYAGMLQRVRLAGDVPRLVPLHPSQQGWRWDLDALQAAISDRTRAIFLGNPSFPSGRVLNDEEWAAVQRICTERQIRLLYWSAMEAIVFGGRKVVVPCRARGDARPHRHTGRRRLRTADDRMADRLDRRVRGGHAPARNGPHLQRACRQRLQPARCDRGAARR